MPISTFPIISIWKLQVAIATKSTWAMTIKNIFSVAANVMNMYAKLQLHTPYGF